MDGSGQQLARAAAVCRQVLLTLTTRFRRVRRAVQIFERFAQLGVFWGERCRRARNSFLATGYQEKRIRCCRRVPQQFTPEQRDAVGSRGSFHTSL